jgi:hypothetical protein
MCYLLKSGLQTFGHWTHYWRAAAALMPLLSGVVTSIDGALKVSYSHGTICTLRSQIINLNDKIVKFPRRSAKVALAA